MSTWNEDTHDRDRAGKFAEMGGSAPESVLSAPAEPTPAPAPPAPRSARQIEQDLTRVRAEIAALKDGERELAKEWAGVTMAKLLPEARHIIASEQAFPNLFDADRRRLVNVSDDTERQIMHQFRKAGVSGVFDLPGPAA